MKDVTIRELLDAIPMGSSLSREGAGLWNIMRADGKTLVHLATADELLRWAGDVILQKAADDVVEAAVDFVRMSRSPNSPDRLETLREKVKHLQAHGEEWVPRRRP